MSGQLVSLVDAVAHLAPRTSTSEELGDDVGAKYKLERAKRLRTDGVAQFREAEGDLATFKDDIWALPLNREPFKEDKEVVVIGGGFAGIMTGVNLQKEGVNDFVVIEKGSDFGGTWYWNQYPGVSCDVEGMIYLPFLEETGYIPKDRFCYGPEIREHVERIVCHWNLREKSYLQTTVTSVEWDQSLNRWQVQTDRGDRIVAKCVITGIGTLHKPKLPAIPGIQNFKGSHFHSGRFDYEVTGGNATSDLFKLHDKTVGIIGTGASGVQLVPQIAKHAKRLCVFQRTPSTVTPRENWKVDKTAVEKLEAGWQEKQMDLFANLMQGEVIDKECTALEGLEALTMRRILKDAQEAGIDATPDKVGKLYKDADLKLMNSLRAHIRDTIRDPETAVKLMPWYSFMCKRPAFHSDYYNAFNSPNVELIDTDGRGVSCITPTGVVANGQAYPIDILIYSTGFDFEVGTSFERRTGIRLVGRKGQTLDEKFASNTPPGPSTMFGIHTRDFPNLFMIGPAQAGVTANQTHTILLAARHIAAVVRMLKCENLAWIEPTAEAEEEWSKQIEQGSDIRLAFHRECPPGYYNAEGKPEDIPVRWGAYPKGVVAWGEVMRAWREEGTWRGMDKFCPSP